MAVSVDTTFNLEVFKPAFQRLFRATGKFNGGTTLTGDASGGSARLLLREADDIDLGFRAFKVLHVTALTDDGVSVAMALQIVGKLASQQEGTATMTVTNVTTGGINALMLANGTTPVGSVELALAALPWFVPNTPGPPHSRFGIELGGANPGAARTWTLRTSGLYLSLR